MLVRCLELRMVRKGFLMFAKISISLARLKSDRNITERILNSSLCLPISSFDTGQSSL